MQAFYSEAILISKQNAEIVRDQYAATNERGFGRAMSHYAEDVEMVIPRERSSR